MSASRTLAPPTRSNDHLRPFAFKSVASTHPGRVREVNEDSSLDRADIGLWAVADGMGGHAAGNFASVSVVEGLNAVRDFSSAFAFRRAVRTALLDVNTTLRRKADEEFGDTIGSTVATLFVHGGHYASIWAGDSRVYLFRQGELIKITRDHSLLQEMVDSGAVADTSALARETAHIITRAVGANDRLDLEGVYGRIEHADRFLLCSDGLGVLSGPEILACMARQTIGAAATALMREALDRGAPDNVTVVVIEAALTE